MAKGLRGCGWCAADVRWVCGVYGGCAGCAVGVQWVCSGVRWVCVGGCAVGV